MGQYVQDCFLLLKKQEIAPGIFQFEIGCPPVVALASPGQFVHIRVPGHTLRRPISICRICPEKGVLTVVFEIKGSGTEALAGLKEGDQVDLMGPLGHGFTILPSQSNVLLVGGGIGVPPMLAVAEHYQKPKVVLGFRSKSAVILQREFEAAGAQLHICTDDGSYGTPGVVTPVFEELIGQGGIDLVCACGPKPMLRAIKQSAEQAGVRCELSLEERMGCGVGACLVCACKGADGKQRHVCKDGPVFDSKEVRFDG